MVFRRISALTVGAYWAYKIKKKYDTGSGEHCTSQDMEWRAWKVHMIIIRREDMRLRDNVDDCYTHTLDTPLGSLVLWRKPVICSARAFTAKSRDVR